MKWYSFDIIKLFCLLLPVRLRRIHTIQFLNALTSPIGALAKDIRYKMQHDGRVIYLEKVLNEAFNIPGYSPTSHEISKQIYIGPGEIPDEVYIFQPDEADRPPYVGDPMHVNDGDAIFLFTRGELDAQYCDFTVVVPSGLDISDIRLKSIVDYYKMAGKKYKIRRI